ncbi:MAG: nucleoside-diphosphate kinase [Chlamydiia bacterium]|nr:nucleoside-diphosphate kinase [Chlamydiia bacterium]
MKRERTLSMIKPDAVQKNIIGRVIVKLEEAGLKVVAAKMVRLSKKEGQQFYAIHKERPFYNDLVDFISSGPLMALILEGEDAIAKNREVMGATNPKEAAAGTIRAEFGDSIDKNVVHGSDAPETAAIEIPFFFNEDEIFE